jgi:predicted nucleic acid-binding protein
MEGFVLDCSATMAWCFGDEATTKTDRLLASLASTRQAHVPAVWSLEVINVLLVAERRKRISRKDASSFLKLLEAMPIVSETELSSPNLEGIHNLGRTHRISAYDASYLELALRKTVPLATLDNKLKAAARTLKIRCLL